MSTDEPALLPLDLRALAPPEPLLRALEAVDALRAGQTLEVLTPMLPLPLIDALLHRGFRVRAEPLEDGTARVRVTAPPREHRIRNGEA
jgi:uncharacterized protein (DUF2249 family)